MCQDIDIGTIDLELDRPTTNRLPVPSPAPVGPSPIPPDWWRCLRVGAVSGRYMGPMTPIAVIGGYELDLRVDIDPRGRNSPPMNRVSADLWEVFRIVVPGRPPRVSRVYRESWIVDSPTVVWSRCQVDISGTVRFWQGTHPATSVAIRIPWSTLAPAGPAEVTLTETGGSSRIFNCARVADCFRDMTLEIDVCQSVNAEPILPVYDTHWHNNRPATTPQRTLTIESAYLEAGICVQIRPGRTIVDDSATAFSTWSPAELHDAMETHFSQYPGGWPKWQMWGLLCGTFDSSGVGGIMFDAAAFYGGAGEAPDRQGFAVFRNHPWFTNLVPGVPANQDQAWAMRHYLYTWVHEAGHAFNFLHSWDKGRPDALSWMNYDWRYDNRNGVDSFWANFRFRLDDDELIHIRHGDRASVIMGADPWASGGHLERAFPAASEVVGDAPLELLVRSKEYFEFMEPISVELRLRNVLPDMPMPVDIRLNPEYGGVGILIRKPDGRIVEYEPLLCRLGIPEVRTLAPHAQGAEGEDRYSESVPLFYGRDGFPFDQPGEYQIRALYQGNGDLLLVSNVHRLRVGQPKSSEDDRLAQDYFAPETGMSLYLGGSRSPHLAKGMTVLEDLSDRAKDTMLGVKAAWTVARSLSRPYFRLEGSNEPRAALKKAYSAEPEKALELTANAIKLLRKTKARALNLTYGALIRDRAHCLAAMGKKAEAKKEVATMRQDLEERGVHPPVLQEFRAFEKAL
jgi:hypothetical protein